MSSWVPIMMLVFTGFFIGGVVSFVRSKLWIMAIAMTIAAVMCGAATIAWWQ